MVRVTFRVIGRNRGAIWYFNMEWTISVKGILWLSFSLLGIVAGTLIQKRYAQHVDLVTGSTYQVECCFIIFSILLLLFMIRHGEATKVASYFYLTPPLAAYWGWLFFDEQWNAITLAGSGLVVGALILIRPMKNSQT